MDPLVLVDRFALNGKREKSIARRVKVRSKYLVGAIRRVERASGLRYPPYYVDPSLPLAASSLEFGSPAALYARVFPLNTETGLSIVVQFTVPLLLFATKATLEAVAAHEFMHYVELVGKLSRMKMVSDERVSTLYESAYADSGRLVDPKWIFAGDRSLVRLVGKKFAEELIDDALNVKVAAGWIEKGLPTRKISPEENAVKLSVESIMTAMFDPVLLVKLRSLEGTKRG